MGYLKNYQTDLGPHNVGGIVKHSIHRGIYREISDEHELIFLHFPGIKRDDLSLRSDDGVLFVGLNGREREIEQVFQLKPSQVGAKLEGDILRLNIPLKRDEFKEEKHEGMLWHSKVCQEESSVP